jgi:hypothetical protein
MPVTEEEAIDVSVRMAKAYSHEERLNDAQAALIGRALWANLRQAERDKVKRAQEDDYL